MYNPYIALLKNEGDSRWHSIVFIADPLPGPPTPDKPERYRSKMHHTTGFATREEAISDIETDLAPKVEQYFGNKPIIDTSTDIPWDGKGIPAMVGFKSEDGKSIISL